MKCHIMKYFLAFAFLTSVPSFAVESSDTCLREKMILIDTELCYCRYLIYEAKHKNIDAIDALEIIDDVFEVIFSQIAEINN